MDGQVKVLYEHGDAEGLMAVARESGDPLADSTGAYRALRLLMRCGDTTATAFCAAAGLLDAEARTRAVAGARRTADEPQHRARGLGA